MNVSEYHDLAHGVLTVRSDDFEPHARPQKWKTPAARTHPTDTDKYQPGLRITTLTTSVVGAGPDHTAYSVAVIEVTADHDNPRDVGLLCDAYASMGLVEAIPTVVEAEWHVSGTGPCKLLSLDLSNAIDPVLVGELLKALYAAAVRWLLERWPASQSAADGPAMDAAFAPPPESETAGPDEIFTHPDGATVRPPTDEENEVLSLIYRGMGLTAGQNDLAAKLFPNDPRFAPVIETTADTAPAAKPAAPATKRAGPNYTVGPAPGIAHRVYADAVAAATAGN